MRRPEKKLVGKWSGNAEIRGKSTMKLAKSGNLETRKFCNSGQSGCTPVHPFYPNSVISQKRRLCIGISVAGGGEIGVGKCGNAGIRGGIQVSVAGGGGNR